MKQFSFYQDKDDSELFRFETETWNEAREQCARMLSVDVSRVHWMPDIAMQEQSVFAQEAAELATELWHRRIEPGNSEDQLAFVTKLLGMLTPFQLTALRFALDMTPKAEAV